MTALCGGGPSGPNSVFASQPYLILAADKLVNFVQTAGMEWLIDWVPGAGQLSFDLNTFCATDPPPIPTIDAARVASWAVAPNGAALLRQDMGALVGHFLWFTTCACSSPPQPTPPAPVSQPTGYQLNPPTVVPPVTGQSCGAYGNTFETMQLGGDPGFWSWQFGTGQMVAGQTMVLVQSSFGTPTTNVWPIDYNLVWYNASLVPIGTPFTWTQDSPRAGQGYDTGIQVPIPANASRGAISYVPRTPTTGATVSANWIYTVYCGNTPGPIQPCCPPDAVSQQLLFQIYSTVQTILGDLGGFTTWADGTRYSNLTGSNQQVISSGTIGVRLEFTSIPPTVRVSPGDPDFYWNLGFLTPLAIDVPLRGWRTIYKTQSFQLPPFTDSVAWTLPDGVAMDLVELHGSN